jgi:hypothetical protein
MRRAHLKNTRGDDKHLKLDAAAKTFSPLLGGAMCAGD